MNKKTHRLQNAITQLPPHQQIALSIRIAHKHFTYVTLKTIPPAYALKIAFTLAVSAISTHIYASMLLSLPETIISITASTFIISVAVFGYLHVTWSVDKILNYNRKRAHWVGTST